MIKIYCFRLLGGCNKYVYFNEISLLWEEMEEWEIGEYLGGN